MGKASFWRAFKFSLLRTGVVLHCIVLMGHPLFISYLWRFWWLRPIILWYSSLTMMMLSNQLFLLLGTVYCVLTARVRTSASKAFFRKYISSFGYAFLKIMHGLEVHGLHNLPKGGGLIVYFHGPFIPTDMCYLHSYVYLKLGRMIGGVIDAKIHAISFIGPVMELFEYSPGREKLIEDLKNGALRSVAPGGAYEAMFSTNNTLEWQSRIGFAKVAKEAGVPVVPMFTSNLHLATPLIDFNRSETIREWYGLTKTPVFLPRYHLPLKLRTYLGEPLYCGKDEEPEEFAKRVKKAIETLRDQHQPSQNSTLQALLERFI